MKKWTRKICTLKTIEGKNVEVSVSYNIGGMNYFNGTVEERGYYIHVTPEVINGRTKVYTAWTGIKQGILNAKKFSAKRLEGLAKGLEEDSTIANVLVRNVLRNQELTLITTEDEFHEFYQPVKNHLDDNASFDGCMFETYGEEVRHINLTLGSKLVWTILENGDTLSYVAGYHFVNRLGYLVTKNPWVTGKEIINIDIKPE